MSTSDSARKFSCQMHIVYAPGHSLIGSKIAVVLPFPAVAGAQSAAAVFFPGFACCAATGP